MPNRITKPFRAQAFIQLYGFPLTMGVVLVLLSLFTDSFLTLRNIMGLLHASAPMVITASGLAMVVMTGKLDISIGSITFLTSTVMAVLVVRVGVSPIVAIPIVLVSGAICGAITGLLVTKLEVNPLIASMGMLFAVRGVALRMTEGRVISLPDSFRAFGNARVGPVYLDVIVALVFIVLVHLLHTRTTYGRHIMALGNDEETAEKLGVRTKKVILTAFIVSGLFASLGGLFTTMQLGAVTLHMGQGLEFTAIAMIVVGGISLFGGEGSMMPGFVLGVITLNLIENGLNHLGASPYAYPFVRGGIIFAAMYADTLKHRVRTRTLGVREAHNA